MSDETLPTRTTLKAARPSLVQSFSIELLYGYRTISLDSEYAATILIAKNGTGKTTLLGAMDAFLTMQLNRLRELPFEKIRCSLSGFSDELVITHDDIVEFLRVPDTPEFIRLASRAGIDPPSMFEFLLSNTGVSLREDRPVSDDKIPSALRSAYNYNYSEAESALERARVEIFSRVENIQKAWSAIKIALSDVEVVYLPTYRRVELALRDDGVRDVYGRRKAPKFSVAAGSLYTGDIQFGLGDISDRLRALNRSIIGVSNNGYRRISANIINDLLDETFSNESYDESDLPTREDLSLFFSRLKDSHRSGPFERVVAPDLDKIFIARDLPESTGKFLTYFLAQLGQVIADTKAVETPVDNFIDVCNRYLRSDEPSTQIRRDVVRADDNGLDGKVLRLNRRTLAVHVEIIPGNRKISLNALSSGEKQMISLFAKLFLYPKRKLVLIDEPELSLSIDWQASILMDVMNAPLCEQVIAITHSPFVFENELDPFARSLRIKNAVDPADSDEIVIGSYSSEYDEDGE